MPIRNGLVCLFAALLLVVALSCGDDDNPPVDGDNSEEDGDTNELIADGDTPDGDTPDGDAPDGDQLADCYDDCKAHCTRAGECIDTVDDDQVLLCQDNCAAKSGNMLLFGCNSAADCDGFVACREAGGNMDYLCAWPQTIPESGD